MIPFLSDPSINVFLNQRIHSMKFSAEKNTQNSVSMCKNWNSLKFYISIFMYGFLLKKKSKSLHHFEMYKGQELHIDIKKIFNNFKDFLIWRSEHKIYYAEARKTILKAMFFFKNFFLTSFITNIFYDIKEIEKRIKWLFLFSNQRVLLAEHDR